MEPLANNEGHQLSGESGVQQYIGGRSRPLGRRRRFGSGNGGWFGGGGRRPWLRWLVIGVVVVLAALAFVRFVVFRARDVGGRAVVVNGETVEQVNGFSVLSTAWVSLPEVQTMFKRIGLPGLTSPKTRRYNGVEYVRAEDVVSHLQAERDTSSFAGNQLNITLRAGQHYTYTSSTGLIRQQEIRVNGQLSSRVLTIVQDEVPFVPATEVAKALSANGLASAWAKGTLNVGLTKPPVLTPVQSSADDAIIAFSSGKAIYAPQFTWHGISYIPVNSVAAVTRQLRWTSSFSTWTWELGSPAAVSKATGSSLTGSFKPEVLGFVPFYSGDTTPYLDVINHSGAFNSLAEDTWEITQNGGLSGGPPAGTVGHAPASGDTVYAMITNMGSSGFNSKEIATVLSDPTRRTRLIQSVLKAVASKNYSGALLDFELVPTEDRQELTSFVGALADALHAHEKKLIVAIPPDTGAGNEPWNGAFDVAKLGAESDAVAVMAYDYSYEGGPAGPIAPLPWVQQVLAYTVSAVPANHVLLGIDTYGYDWSGKNTIAVSLPNVDTFLKQRHITPKWDKSAAAPWFTWRDSQGQLHTVYYENGRSVAMRLALAKTYGIKGVAVWRAGLEDAGVRQALHQYQATSIP